MKEIGKERRFVAQVYAGYKPMTLRLRGVFSTSLLQPQPHQSTILVLQQIAFSKKMDVKYYDATKLLVLLLHNQVNWGNNLILKKV